MTASTAAKKKKSKSRERTRDEAIVAAASPKKSEKKAKKEEAKDEEAPAAVAEVSENEDERVAQGDDDEEGASDEDAEPPIKLYKSTRLKGYITLLLASAINYSAASQSDLAILNTAVPASPEQKSYAMAVSMVTMILSICIVIVHLDRTPLRKIWVKGFRPKSKIELGFILFLVIWWIVATWIQTSVGGIAGTGKGQYNLYFSTWACCWTSIWTFERWIVASGMASFKHFLAEWPNRAPSWIATLFMSFCTLLTYLDSFLNWEDKGSVALQEQLSKVGKSQWEWLLFVASVTIPSAMVFVIVEVFRTQGPQGDSNKKSQWETILEGVILLMLVIGWIPSVMVATTPGGIANLVGNTYFFTWATTVFVMETFVWWIHDWRKNIHLVLQHQQEEYEKIQEKVMAKSEAVLRECDDMSVTHVEGSDGDNNDQDDTAEEEATTYSERIPDSVGA